VSLKHVINLIMQIRDMGCHKPRAVVDMLLVSWCSWTSGMSSKAGCSGPSVMVERT
jgi:hypothetical protein